MKKLMFAAVAALAMVGAANAAQSYGIGADNYVKPYELDTAPGGSHSGWYSCYVMKQEDAQKAMGTTTTVTYETMAAWLDENFADNKQSVIDNAEQIAYFYYSGSSQYNFYKGGANGVNLGSAIGVFFYDDGANVAYNVMPNTNVSNFRFNDSSSSGTGSGWVAATTGGVPEPTSGLLLLLGVAGLALRRKRQ